MSVNNPNLSPYEQAVKVTVDTVIVHNEIKSCKERIQRGDDYFKTEHVTPGSSDEVFEIEPRMPVFQIVSEHNSPQSAHRYPEVFQCLNGRFSKSTRRVDLEDKCILVGFAASAVPFDSKNGNMSSDLAAISGGGPITTLNTGNKFIPNGAKLLYIAPDKSDPFQVNRKESGRIIMWLVPFDAAIHALSAQLLFDIAKSSSKITVMKDQYGHPTDGSYENPVDSAARKLLKGLMANALLSLHAFMLSGIITLDRNAIIDKGARNRNASQYYESLNDGPNGFKENKTMQAICYQLGLDVSSNPGQHKQTQRRYLETSLKSSDPSLQNNQSFKDYTMKEILCNVFFPEYEKREFLVEPNQTVTGSIPKDSHGDLLRLQYAFIQDMFIALDEGDFYKRKIVATAQTPARSGDVIQILPANYEC